MSLCAKVNKGGGGRIRKPVARTEFSFSLFLFEYGNLRGSCASFRSDCCSQRADGRCFNGLQAASGTIVGAISSLMRAMTGTDQGGLYKV